MPFYINLYRFKYLVEPDMLAAPVPKHVFVAMGSKMNISFKC